MLNPWGGDYFTDYTDDIAGIIGINIYSTHLVVSIQVTYRLKNGSTYTTPLRGGTEGTMYSFTLAEGETLTRVEGKPTYNVYVLEYLTFYSNLNNTYGPYRRSGSITPYTFFVEGQEIVAFFGRYGDLLDAIGVYYIN